MAATTGQLGLVTPTQGDLSGVWGDTVNNGITEYTNIAIAGTLTLTGDGAVTLQNTTGNNTTSNITSTLTGAGTVTAQFAIVRVTGTLTTAKIITGPSYSKTYLVVNAATGSTVSFIRSGQTPAISIAVGESALVYFNGTDYVKLTGTATAGAAGGSNTQVQYNSSGVLAGSANMTFDGTTLTAAGFSGPHNGTVGATTPSTGAFTTIRSSTGASSAIFGGGSSSNEVVTITAQTGGLGIGLGIQNSSSNLSGISFPTNASATTAYTYITADGRSGASGFIKSYVNDAVVSTLTSTGLGIGTTSPAYKLDVNTTANSFFQGIQVRNLSAGSSATSSYALGQDTNAGAAAIFLNSSANTGYGGANSLNIYNGLNAPIAFYTNGTKQATLDGAGNLGLGVTPSAWGGAYKAIDIGPSVSLASSGGLTSTLLTSNSYYNGTNYIYKNTAASSYYLQSSGAHYWYTAASGTAGNAITFSQAMTLDASGNLGVGTTSPAERLHISNGASTAQIRIQGQSRNFYIGQDATGALVYSDGAVQMGFYTNATQRFVIGASGQLGIGASPSYGTSGQVLTSGGSGAAPTWTTVSGGGSAATPTALGTVYGLTSGNATPYTTALGYNAAAATPSGTYVVAIGYGALSSNTTAANNIAIGYQAGFLTTTGSNNVSIGYNAGYSNVSSSSSVAIGYSALYFNVGSNSTAVGHFAAYSKSGGGSVAAFGRYASYSETTASDNTSVGVNASFSTTTGSSNTAVGFNSFYGNTTGANNTALGASVFQNNTTGDSGTGIGYRALFSNTTGVNSTAVGAYAGYTNTTSNAIVAVGYEAFYLANNGNTDSYAATAIGYRAGRSSTTARDSTFVGGFAGYNNTTGYRNTAVGAGALYANTTANDNTAVGYQALDANTTGTFNVAVGNDALGSNTTGSANTSVGYQAGSINTTGTRVTFLGYLAGTNSTGNYNTCVGAYAGYTITSGSNNTLIGDNAASAVLTTGVNNIYVGAQNTASSAAVASEIVISGNGVTGKGSTTGFINPGSGGVYQGNNAATWSVTSDQRLKKNIVDNNDGLEAIASIRVRNFEYRLPNEVDAELKPTDAIQKTGVQLGVIAQELQAVLPDCVKTESTGVMSVNSDNLTWYMINAIKELKAEVDSLKSQLKGA